MIHVAIGLTFGYVVTINGLLDWVRVLDHLGLFNHLINIIVKCFNVCSELQ